MKNLEGIKIPKIIFKTRVGSEWVEKTTDDYFKGKKVVLFALPGAFTPTCSSTHLPRYNELYNAFKENGIDDVICLSVNDTFVMNAWQEDQKAHNITMLPDGNGELSKSLEMLVDKSEIGFGPRSWRYSIYVEDGVIKKHFSEEEIEGDPFDVSDADTMLDYLKIDKPKSVSIYTRDGCVFCEKAKRLLNSKGLVYEEHTLNKDYSIKTLVAISGRKSFPQVFIDGKHIGGSDELEKLLED